MTEPPIGWLLDITRIGTRYSPAHDAFPGKRASPLRGVGRLAAGLLAFALAGCAPALPVDHFASTAPAFDPLVFFTGHTTSWGVIENRAGSPSDIVITDCVGTADGPDGLQMVQHVTNADGTTLRQWHLRRLGPHQFQATANDMVGGASGEAQGRVFHWHWILATRPGTSWRNVDFEQWMYLMDDGSMVNRTVVRKLGITLAEVTEQFHHVP